MSGTNKSYSGAFAAGIGFLAFKAFERPAAGIIGFILKFLFMILGILIWVFIWLSLIALCLIFCAVLYLAGLIVDSVRDRKEYKKFNADYEKRSVVNTQRKELIESKEGREEILRNRTYYSAIIKWDTHRFGDEDMGDGDRGGSYFPPTKNSRSFRNARWNCCSQYHKTKEQARACGYGETARWSKAAEELPGYCYKKVVAEIQELRKPEADTTSAIGAKSETTSCQTKN